MPTKAFRFKLEIEGLEAGSFSEISGLDATFDVIEHRNGDDTLITPHKDPGLIKYGNITLKYVVSDNTALYDWIDEIREGDISKKTVTISVLGDTLDDVDASWQLRDAWPVKYTAASLNSTASELAFETIELAHIGITRES
jgi:phage tail-like protein